MPALSATHPRAVLPGGELTLHGADLGPGLQAHFGEEHSPVPALVTMARPARATVRVPEGILPGPVTVSRGPDSVLSRSIAVGVPMAENIHPVANPAVDRSGSVYTTLSGPRGQETPVSVFRIPPARGALTPESETHDLHPFAREILNASGLAFGPDGDLYVSSRAEGTVYRVSPDGLVQTYAEGLGIATGLAFDPEGNLYVGDRSGTIFKIRPARRRGLFSTLHSDEQAQETFVFATLEPSIAAYHLAFSGDGTLFVTGPTTSSSQTITAIDRDGTARPFFRGLGRAQGMAFDVDDNLYVVASYRGERGIHRITPALQTELILSGPDLVGLAFLPFGRAALTTRTAVYLVELGITGRPLQF